MGMLGFFFSVNYLTLKLVIGFFGEILWYNCRGLILIALGKKKIKRKSHKKIEKVLRNGKEKKSRKPLEREKILI